MISGKVVKQGLKKVIAASPMIGIALVSAVITKYIVDDIKEKHGKGKKDPDDVEIVILDPEEEEKDSEE
jgi:hypothetical protein